MNISSLRPVFGLALLLGAALCAGGARAQGEAPVDVGPPHHLEAGTTLKIRLLKDFHAADAHVGDHVQAEVAGDDPNDLPAGTLLFGHVTWIKPSGGEKAGEADVSFDLQRGDGPDAFRDAASVHLVGKEDRKALEERAKKGAGAGAGLGALLGAVLGRKHTLGDAVGGAVLGALGGAAANALAKKHGADVSLKSGDEIEVHLDRSLNLGGAAY